MRKWIRRKMIMSKRKKDHVIPQQPALIRFYDNGWRVGLYVRSSKKYTYILTLAANQATKLLKLSARQAMLLLDHAIPMDKLIERYNKGDLTTATKREIQYCLNS